MILLLCIFVCDNVKILYAKKHTFKLYVHIFRDQYESYDFAAELKKFKDTGDTTRMAMMLQVYLEIIY